MKIGSVKIQNFRSILSTSFNLCTGVTAFAGGNESGKSNVLLALEKFLNKEDFDTTDTYQLSNEVPCIEITFYNFTDEEKGKLLAQCGVSDIDKLVIKRTGDTYEIIYPINPTVKQSQPEEVTEQATAAEETEEANEEEKSTEESKISADELVDNVVNMIPDAELIRSVEALVEGKNIPIADIFPTKEREEEIAKDTDRLAKLGTIRALLSLGEITEEIVNNKDFSIRSYLLQKASAKIAKKINDSWSQEDVKMAIEADQTSLLIKFRDGKNRPEDKEDDTKWIWTHPEDRSTGFRWYVTFYVRYLARLETSNNVVFLIDDAGAPLNKVAQQDLLKEFFKKANEKTDLQIAYATHSKYMVDWDFRDNIMMTIKENGEGTKVNEMWWEKYSPSERSAPLDELGVTWADDFLKSDNLIVEGMTDVYVLHHLPNSLLDTIGPDPYKGFKVIPAGRASLEKSLGELSKINGRKAFLLFDSDVEGAKECLRARGSSEKGILECSQIKAVIGNNSAFKVITIEDLLPMQKYLDAFNFIAKKEFGDKWSDIRSLNIASSGSEKAIFDKFEAMGIMANEKAAFKKLHKFNVVKRAVDNTSLTDYQNQAQLRAVQNFFKNLKKRLAKIESSKSPASS